VVDCLVNHNADINATTIYYKTPLHYASYIGDLRVIECLVDNNADINATDYSFDTMVLMKPLFIMQLKKEILVL